MSNDGAQMMNHIYNLDACHGTRVGSHGYVRDEVRSKTIFRICVLEADTISIGILRNISESGAQIEVPSNFPKFGEFIYEHDLACAKRARIIWAHGNLRGVTDLEDISPRSGVSYFARDGACRALRLPVIVSSKSWIGEQAIRGDVINLSQRGACIAHDGGMQVAEHSSGMNKLGQMEPRPISVRWTGQKELGVRFEVPLSITEFANTVSDGQVANLASRHSEAETAKLQELGDFIAS